MCALPFLSEESLSRSSRVDGMHRLKLSESQLPFAVGQHAIEPELPVFAAHARSVTGKNAAKWLRQVCVFISSTHARDGHIIELCCLHRVS
jgi:hypothetical protein